VTIHPFRVGIRYNMANKTVFLTVNFTIDGQYRNAWTYHLPAN